MISEVLGYRVTLPFSAVQSFAKNPLLPEEKAEYCKIWEMLANKVNHREQNYRRHTLVSEEWKQYWIDNHTCWLSFQYIRNGRDPNRLIAVMRSCDIKKMASDLGFVCQMAVSLSNGSPIEVDFMVGSLHVRGEDE